MVRDDTERKPQRHERGVMCVRSIIEAYVETKF